MLDWWPNVCPENIPHTVTPPPAWSVKTREVGAVEAKSWPFHQQNFLCSPQPQILYTVYWVNLAVQPVGHNSTILGGWNETVVIDFCLARRCLDSAGRHEPMFSTLCQQLIRALTVSENRSAYTNRLGLNRFSSRTRRTRGNKVSFQNRRSFQLRFATHSSKPEARNRRIRVIRLWCVCYWNAAMHQCVQVNLIPKQPF